VSRIWVKLMSGIEDASLRYRGLLTLDYVIKDINLAEFGRKELDIADTEMPGLMVLCEEFGENQPLKGSRIVGSLHMTIQTAILTVSNRLDGALLALKSKVFTHDIYGCDS
jgi:S-adenosylhomocysteine hydrolase